MIANQTFTPSRLTLARQRRGITISQLSESIGLTAQSLSNAERGRQNPSTATVRLIADVLDFPESFFYAPDLEELKENQLSFRARSKTSARAKNAVRSSARIAVELRHWIDKQFVTPRVNIPSIETNMTPELAAEHVRARWGLDPLQSVPNCIHTLEANGVAVFSLPPEYRDVDAFSFWWRGVPFILLSTTKTAERSRFDAAHELGHLVLHQNTDYVSDWRAAEREANEFAASFLMPRPSVEKHVSRPVTTDRIIRSKKRWKVAAMALAYRLNEVGLLTEWTYRQAVIELGRLGYRSGEPEGIERESSLLLRKVLAALRAERVTLGVIASQLDVSADELRHLTFSLVLRSAGAGDAASSSDEPPDVPPSRNFRIVR